MSNMFEGSLYLPNEFIIGVAIKVPGNVVWMKAPARHGDIFREMSYINVELNHPEQMQGFWTNYDRFINRIDAADMVRDQGVPLREQIRGNKLFSENLW